MLSRLFGRSSDGQSRGRENELLEKYLAIEQLCVDRRYEGAFQAVGLLLRLYVEYADVEGETLRRVKEAIVGYPRMGGLTRHMRHSEDVGPMSHLLTHLSAARELLLIDDTVKLAVDSQVSETVTARYLREASTGVIAVGASADRVASALAVANKAAKLEQQSSWKCPDGHANEVTATRCEICSFSRPQRTFDGDFVVTKLPSPVKNAVDAEENKVKALLSTTTAARQALSELAVATSLRESSTASGPGVSTVEQRLRALQGAAQAAMR